MADLKPSARTRAQSAYPLKAAALVVLSLVILAHRAPAQQPDTAAVLKKLSVEELMNVLVTSVSKRAEPLSRAASAIQVITGEDIRRSGATSLPEALRLASNLQVAQVDSRQWAISARGFNGTAANKLLVLIDGRTVYTPLFSGVFWDVQNLSLADIDRIEVISGPGATLWGANAVNGVINIITKNAGDTQGLLGSGGGGTELHGFGTVRYGGAAGSRVRYRIYGYGFGRDATTLPNGQEGRDDWHMGQGGLRLDWDASNIDSVTLQGDRYDGRSKQPSGNDIAISGDNAVGQWSHTLSANADVRVKLYYDRTHRNIPGTFSEDLDTYDVDFQHHVRLGGRHDVVWGLSYRLINDNVGNTTALAFLPPHVVRRWFGGFLQDEIALVGDRLAASIGAKIEHNDYTGVELQPSGRVSWRMSPASTLWAAVSRALRTPSRIDREFYAPGQPPYLLAGGPGFHSEEELAYELGYRVQHEALAVSLASFYNHYHGLRSLERTNPPAAFPVVIGNGQEGESYGAELTADYRVTDRWRLRAGYTELRIHVWPNSTSTDTSRGNSENHTPSHQFSLQSSADLPAHLHLDGGFRYVSEIANQQVPGYAELDTRLTWQPTANLDLSVVGQNLLHRRHVEFGTPAARREI